MSQSYAISSYRFHPENHRPLSLTLRFPHLDQGIQEIKVSYWSDVLIQFVSLGLSNIDPMSRLKAGWSPIPYKPPLFCMSYREGYQQINANLFIFEYDAAPHVQTCLDQMVEKLSLSHDCYEIALMPEPKMSIYAYKGVNGW